MQANEKEPETAARTDDAGHRGSLANKTVVVTGGANGLGQASALALAQQGALVAVLDRDPADETLALAEAAGTSVIAYTCDLAVEDEITATLTELEQAHGAADILLHCAAAYPPQAFEDISTADWRMLMEVNLESAFHLCQKMLPSMCARGWGRVVFIASTTIFTGHPVEAHYVATKAGLVGLMRSLAREYGRFGVTFNAVAPGAIQTQRGRVAHKMMGGEDFYENLVSRQSIKRIGEPKDIAGPVCFFVSPQADFITGQTLCVDGGLVLR